MNNAQIGLIGETAVKLKLLEMGWNAINLNDAIRNFKGADLICINGKETCLIQVKTCPNPGKNPNIRTGLISDCKGHIKDLKEKVVGPWVFVHINGEGPKAEYDFYILTRQEVIELITTSNDWYVKQKKKIRVKTYRLVCIFRGYVVSDTTATPKTITHTKAS